MKPPPAPRGLTVLVALFLVSLPGTHACAQPPPAAWPAPTSQSKPWTRWWWLGSGVDDDNLGRLLTQFRDAGLGGVEICPIYGAKGYEDRFLPYLSPAWVDRFEFTVTKAHSLGLGVDLTTGTGWPFGGPWVSDQDASSSLILSRQSLAEGDSLKDPPTRAPLVAATALDQAGRSRFLTQAIRDGSLQWTAPKGTWTVYLAQRKGPIQKVKRSAPGGEGNVMDPLSAKAMDHYLERYESAFAGRKNWPRAQFHDSYEYYGASMTPDLFRAFKAARGYDLSEQLPALSGAGPAEIVSRVKSDYRQTVGELHESYLQRWNAWTRSHGGLSREQAHGAPANIEDLYASADIPETEVFGEPTPGLAPMVKFASSAAHVTGKPLASSETFTWLGEHFQVPLSALKPEIDFLFLNGINHIFFHGIPYSPADAPWPGWLFYASVNFGPEGGLWHDLPGFLSYATRCQSVLQEGKPSSDILLYFPVFEFWQTPEDLLIPFKTPGEWMAASAFHADALELGRRGYAYEEVTDRLLSAASADSRGTNLAGLSYETIVIPSCEVMPVETFAKLVALARSGATVAFQGKLPDDVPGYNTFQERRAALRRLVSALPAGTLDAAGVRRVPLGQGLLLVGNDLGALLEYARVRRESMADLGLQCIRRQRGDGFDYFIVNGTRQPVDRWIPLATPAKAALLMDPQQSARIGAAAIRPGHDFGTDVYLQLGAGESVILRTSAEALASGTPSWSYLSGLGKPLPIDGAWSVSFTQGGPVLPRPYATRNLGAWTDQDDPQAKRFAGTAAYAIDFTVDPGVAADWVLDLGKVCDSARVSLNGHDVGILWSDPARCRVGPYLVRGLNHLIVEVTNVAANRIADLDRRKVGWKAFYEINFVNKDYHPFDASGWPLRPSGLIGPVRLLGQQRLEP